MSPLLANFHFLRPWWLLALAALLLPAWFWSRHAAQAGAWRGAVDAHLLPHLLERPASARASRWPLWLAACAWVIACLAAAGPAWERLEQPLFQNRAARVYLLELAPSMAAQDVKPSRYERARFKLDDLLAHGGDGQVALVAYAGDAFVVAPLTDDARTVSNLIDALDPSVMPVVGNDTGRAIDLGVKLIKQADLDGGQIVLLADSVAGDGTSAARRARAAGIRVDVLGIGTAQGAPVTLPQGGFMKDAAGNIALPKLDAGALQALARTGGGDYVAPTPDGADVQRILALQPAAQAATAAQHAQAERWRDRGPWLALLLVPLVACGFRRGWLMLLPLALLAHSDPAAAFSWQDLWQRPDQQARAALDAGDAAAAQRLAHDPALRGVAAYRAGDFAAATRDFSAPADAQAAYNRGNALARQGQYEQAIAAYDDALARQPGMADAIANRKAVEDWLKQQRDKQKSKDNEHGKQGKGEQGGQQKQDQEQQQGDGQNGQKDSDPQQGNGRQGQPQSGKDANADPAQGNGQSSSTQGDDEKQSADRQDTNAAHGGKDGQSPQAAAQQSGERAAAQQFRKDMDQALHAQQGKQEPNPAVQLGAREGQAQDEHQQAVEQWLQRVPDDPGGLLRRKFLLEYQIRRNGGRVPQDEGD